MSACGCVVSWWGCWLWLAWGNCSVVWGLASRWGVYEGGYMGSRVNARMSRVGSVCLAVVCVFCSSWGCGRPLYACLPVLCVPFGWSCLGVLVTGFSMVPASMGAVWWLLCMNLGGSGAFRWYVGVKVRAGKVVCFSSLLPLGGVACSPLGLFGRVLGGAPCLGFVFVVAVGEGRCGWGWPSGWVGCAGREGLNVHRMKKRSCYARGRCTGYPVILH